MKTIARKRLKTAVLASAALLAVTVISPQPVKADPTLAVALGGSALLGVILHTNQPIPVVAPALRKSSPVIGIAGGHYGYLQTGSVFNHPPHSVFNHPPHYVVGSVAPLVSMQSYPRYGVYATVPVVSKLHTQKYYVVQSTVNYY